MSAEPNALARVEGVAGEAIDSKAVVGAHVIVCATRVVVKLMLDEVAAAKVAPALTEAVNVQVPAATNATSPDEELIVQTASVVLA